MPQYASALVQPLSSETVAEIERRSSPRYPSNREALARPIEGSDAIWWGAKVRDLSTTGIGLSLCFPFRPGTFLAVDLQGPIGGTHTLLTRVVHARDQSDGTWHVGCEFVKALTDSEVELMV
jgi:hypothetical protein